MAPSRRFFGLFQSLFERRLNLGGWGRNRSAREELLAGCLRGEARPRSLCLGAMPTQAWKNLGPIGSLPGGLYQAMVLQCALATFRSHDKPIQAS